MNLRAGVFGSRFKCGLVFDHRDHKERKEAANLHLSCLFFVFCVFFVVGCVLHLEFLAFGGQVVYEPVSVFSMRRSGTSHMMATRTNSPKANQELASASGMAAA